MPAAFVRGGTGNPAGGVGIPAAFIGGGGGMFLGPAVPIIIGGMGGIGGAPDILGGVGRLPVPIMIGGGGGGVAVFVSVTSTAFDDLAGSVPLLAPFEGSGLPVSLAPTDLEVLLNSGSAFSVSFNLAFGTSVFSAFGGLLDFSALGAGAVPFGFSGFAGSVSLPAAFGVPVPIDLGGFPVPIAGLLFSGLAGTVLFPLSDNVPLRLAGSAALVSVVLVLTVVFEITTAVLLLREGMAVVLAPWEMVMVEVTVVAGDETVEVTF